MTDKISQESKRIASEVVSGVDLKPLALQALQNRLARAIEASWQRGFDDARTLARLQEMNLAREIKS